MNKKIIVPGIVVIILLVAGFIYIQKSTAASVPAPTATPAATEPPEAAATPEPTPTVTPADTEETEEVVDKNSPEYIKKEYNQEGKTLTPTLEEEGCYVDEDGIIRYSDGIPVQFYDDSMLPEGFTYEGSPEDNPNLMTEEERQATIDALDGKNQEINDTINKLYEEGYFN